MKSQNIVIRIDCKKKERFKTIAMNRGKSISCEINNMIDNYIYNNGIFEKGNDEIKASKISKCFVRIYDELNNENIDRNHLLKELGKLECLF